MTLLGHIGLELDPECRLELAGEVDGTSTAQMREALDLLAAAPPRAVTVDLAQATFFDANGARFLFAVHDLVATAGGHVTVVGAGAPIRRALEFTRLDRVLDVRDSVTSGQSVAPGTGTAATMPTPVGARS
ncbi:MAG: Anti-sigma factor antagonist [Mycobacterium sp.]|jgi:anti-sigma B factor antagonist|nr:Anti-sigma factor antagonist [Mycobacterium sp.]